jgi:hypothetical protein
MVLDYLDFSLFYYLNIQMSSVIKIAILICCNCREYEADKASQRAVGGGFPMFHDWIRDAVSARAALDPSIDRDVILLSNPPLLRIKTYTRMMAYGNHYRVLDSDTPYSVTYDSGLITVFEHLNESPLTSGWMEMGYVGELVGIWVLEYGNTSSPIILMKGSWVRQSWGGSNATMKRDGDGFLLVDFRAILPEWLEPFVFPSQVEQAFFLDVEDSRGWRVVCHKQARNRRIEDTTLAFNLDSNHAFERHRPHVAREVRASRDFVPLTRMDNWAGEETVDEQEPDNGQ